MKVSYASQIFSHYVASVMQLLSSVKEHTGFTSYIQCFSYSGLDKSATETAEILSFFDKLFDSVNGYALLYSHGKELKCAVSDSSGHIEYWRNTRKALKNMYFIKPVTNEKIIPPSIKNWIRTLAGKEEFKKNA
ncbi:hypothetical protein NQ315_010016 [Exocentrus adspersus]|uniref:LAGLIDADG homing endonuclease n=1 Tax=Exocentrus adspersus TaxID=1586481 RepID=A0AAV8VJM8_9CUCU|nr:hypothetical protein NQ315_010016 [Exocentrus adspersus]